jgi:hypothetical protein
MYVDSPLIRSCKQELKIFPSIEYAQFILERRSGRLWRCADRATPMAVASPALNIQRVAFGYQLPHYHITPFPILSIAQIPPPSLPFAIFTSITLHYP